MRQTEIPHFPCLDFLLNFVMSVTRLDDVLVVLFNVATVPWKKGSRECREMHDPHSTCVQTFFLKFTSHYMCRYDNKLNGSGNRNVISHRGRVPVGVQVVVGLRVIWRCPDLVQ
jgi:hypothetical protein